MHPADNHSTTMNIYSAWMMGLTGRGVKVVHIDDGINYMHRDLKYNFYTKSKSLPSAELIGHYDRERDITKITNGRNKFTITAQEIFDQ